jgi:GntR family transcriptional regulator/MocR family aminotransferase
MDGSWTIPGLDLLIDPEPGAGRRVGLERALRDAVCEGRLPPGARLPSTRALAQELGLARGTVSEAYAQLVAEGYLMARQGAGTVVAPRGGPMEEAPAEAMAPPDPRFDFHPGMPDLGSFPRARWLAAMRRALRTAPDGAFAYGDPRGRPELRRSLAEYLGRARGVLTSPDRVVICGGFHQALGLLGEALRLLGARAVAMEDPTIPDHRTVVERAGLQVIDAPVDADGLLVDDLARESIQAAVVTPAHQSPLGGTLRADRRTALIRWARAADAIVVEDDYDGEFRYDRQPIGALQGLDPERVVYAGTASKSLAPGLRLAWLALPTRLLEPFVEARREADRSGGALEQLALAQLLESGDFDRHVRRQRQVYRRRRDALLAALAARVPSLRPVGVAAGLHVVLRLPPRWPGEAEVLARAAGRSIGLFGLGWFYHRPSDGPGGLVVGYAAPPRHVFPAAVRALADTLAGLDR